MNYFRKLSTDIPDETSAILSLNNQIKLFERSFNILFFSSKYNAKKIELELQKSLSKNTVAVSTAGEISDGTYFENSISGFSINLDQSHVDSYLVENINELEKQNLNLLSKFIDSIKMKPKKPGTKTICMVLVDGLSGSEETLMEFIGDAIKDFPVVGGSSGDRLEFKNTSLIFDGKNHQNAAILLFITTDAPFEIIKTQHFKTSNKKLVITEAVPSLRIVQQIDGLPAALAYANILGKRVDELNAKVFSDYPLALNIAGNCFIRSIRNVNPDLSLTFYCAIENGLVLSIALKNDIVSSTEDHLNSISEKMSGSRIAILFECILRRLEVINLNQDKKESLFNLYKNVNGVGFHTYGEQLNTIHINQTLTGVLFGKK